IHQYWFYYLGPPLALAAASGVVGLARFGSSQRSGLLLGAVAIILLVFTGANGIAAYFRRITCQPEFIQRWKEIHASTGPFDRVILPFSPFLEERHGGYTFRNVVSAQLAYYLD